jgi:DNA-binding LacI/PurR family transcriptional regulator
MENPEKKRLGRPPGPRSIHSALAESIRASITSGKLKPGALLPSRRQLAKQHQTGERSVRLALERLALGGFVRKNTKGKWRVALRSHTASAQTNLVALVLGHLLNIHLKDPIWAMIHRGIAEMISQCRSPLLIVQGNPNMLCAHVPPDLPDLSPRGILLAGNFSLNCLREYAKLNVPVIQLDQAPRNPGLSAVCVDNFTSARDAVLRLVKMGHRRIAFCRRMLTSLADIDPDSKERHTGFVAGMQAAGLHNKKSGVFSFFSKDTPEAAAIQSLLKETPPYTTVLAADATIANLIYEAEKTHGDKTRQKLTIACFDSVESPLPFPGPRIDFEDMGRLAIQLLDTPKTHPVVKRLPTVWHTHGISAISRA